MKFIFFLILLISKTLEEACKQDNIKSLITDCHNDKESEGNTIHNQSNLLLG
jgi:hypothetical protein